MAILRRFTTLVAFCNLVIGSATKSHCACTNSPSRRDCWREGFDIRSDYEKVIPKGRLREVRALHRILILCRIHNSLYIRGECL